LYYVERDRKRALLTHLVKEDLEGSVLVFTRTKRGADRVAKDLMSAGLRVAAIHGDKSQMARQRALQDFKSGKTRVLVATDIAARGIDIAELPFVVNYDVPESPETYVHRIGRTGRAGRAGVALTIATPEDRNPLRDIEKLIKMRIPTVRDHPFEG
ncbi:MAG: helicase-related protein, partial [Ignavibacteria bacterium]